uniref:Uncharacterized protein n=1 Tax=Micrurus carvalhoi TaxID=3147026 RepID=A0A2H6NCQ8_9SAUR
MRIPDDPDNKDFVMDVLLSYLSICICTEHKIYFVQTAELASAAQHFGGGGALQREGAAPPLLLQHAAAGRQLQKRREAAVGQSLLRPCPSGCKGRGLWQKGELHQPAIKPVFLKCCKRKAGLEQLTGAESSKRRSEGGSLSPAFNLPIIKISRQY